MATKKETGFIARVHSLRGRKVMILVIGLGCAVFLLGILFKLLHWPGASDVLLCGCTTCIISSVWVSFALNKVLSEEEKEN